MTVGVVTISASVRQNNEIAMNEAAHQKESLEYTAR
jgi:hypothetical protein